MRTKAVIEYGAMDLTAKVDSEPTATNKQSFSDPSGIKTDPIETKYSTLEKNYFILDGSLTNMPANVGNVGWWSLSMTGENKQFSSPLTLTINFSQNHTSVGLTLKFSQYSYCTHVKIQYYDSGNTLIHEEEYYPDNWEYFCEYEAVNYRKIVISFYSTNEAYRYIKLYGIGYGKTIVFEGESLISANIIEEINPLSDELSINTIDFVCFATDDRFNILNPQGAFLAFQKTQPIKAYKVANGVTTDMGSFYMESWENESEKSMRITGIDLIGILDKAEFNGGIYEGASATTVIQSIFTAANITNYTISGLTSVTITGYIPICTCREALQQVLFATGTIANCGRAGKINIYKLTESGSPAEINKDVILKDTKEIKQAEIVTGVSVTTHTYKLKREEEILYEENLAAGTYRVKFNAPATNLTIQNGTIIESGVNYAIITATGSGSQASTKYYENRNVQIKGNTYDDLTNTVTVLDGEVHDTTNIIAVENCTLINGDNASEIATRILNHYKGSYQDSFEMILSSQKVGDNVITEKSEVNELNGFITKLDIDMTGGFLAKAEVMAKVEEV